MHKACKPKLSVAYGYPSSRRWQEPPQNAGIIRRFRPELVCDECRPSPDMTPHEHKFSESLSHQVVDGQRALRGFALHHLLYILCDQIRFKIYGIARFQRVKVSHLDCVRDDSDRA